jgi:hypothetical protein
MKHEARNKQAGVLPHYLGLGTLDPSSTYEANGMIKAKYKLGTETIYDVAVSAQQSEIVEYFGGKELARSVGQKLGQAFFYHMMGLPIEDHPRLQELFTEITTGRNIHVLCNPKHKFVMYPAGICFVLNLPVASSNRATWEAFTGWQDDLDNTDPLRPESIHGGHILKLSSQGDVLVESVTIAKYSTLLIRLKPAVDLIVESGLVLPEKENRLTVMPFQESAASRLRIYPGDEDRGFLTFSVLALSQAELAEHGLVELFREGSLQLLSNLPANQELRE